MNVDVLTSTEHSLTEAGLESSSSHVVPAGSVVIATRVGLGKAVILAQDTAINQDLRGLVIHDHGKVTDKFLYWWYRSIAGHVISAGTGATVQGVTLPFIASLEVPVPSLAEQHRIVAKLDEVHSACAEVLTNIERRKAKAGELRQSVLAAAFRGEL
jgi:type I restriction enzyme S subunit